MLQTGYWNRYWNNYWNNSYWQNYGTSTKVPIYVVNLRIKNIIDVDLNIREIYQNIKLEIRK